MDRWLADIPNPRPQSVNGVKKPDQSRKHNPVLCCALHFDLVLHELNHLQVDVVGSVNPENIVMFENNIITTSKAPEAPGPFAIAAVWAKSRTAGCAIVVAGFQAALVCFLAISMGGRTSVDPALYRPLDLRRWEKPAHQAANSRFLLPAGYAGS